MLGQEEICKCELQGQAEKILSSYSVYLLSPHMVMRCITTDVVFKQQHQK